MKPPPHTDLTLTCQEIALACGVSMSRAYRWKKEAGIPMKRGYTGVRKSSAARLVTPQEWAQGCHHVAKLLGISHQAAWLARNRLIAEGHDLPRLGRGRRSQAAITQGTMKN